MKYLLLIFLIGLSSCKINDPSGLYNLKNFPKTTLEIRNNGSFEYISINPNPYLLPFDHPDENYFITRGSWKSEKGKITLLSSKDSTYSNRAHLLEAVYITLPIDTLNKITPPEFLDYSSFTFFDIYNDTVDVLYAQAPDSSFMALLHKSMRSIEWPSSYNDTIEFHFYGYEPFTFIREDKARKEIKIKLYPIYRSDIFSNDSFPLKNDKINIKRMVFKRNKK